MIKERYYYTPEHLQKVILKNLENKYDFTAYLTTVLSTSNVPRVTICGLWDTEGNYLHFGAAKCSVKDKFEKKIGRELAKTRALTNPIFSIPVTEKDVSDKFMRIAKELEKEYFEKKHVKF